MNESEQLRPLTPAELELFRWMFEHGSEDLRTFLPQMAGIRAARSCDCGCPSIRLQVTEGAPLGTDHGERLIGDFEGRTAREELVGILLFQSAGKLIELEIYSMDGQIKGDSSEFGLPLIDSMSVLQWEPIPGRPNAKRAVKSPESPA
jgi:hypothetical protein